MATVVLAHGAWSAAWVWKKVRPLMRAAGHEFYTPTYTGLGEREHLANPSNDLETHIEDVLGVIRAEELSAVVLLGHSYGGMVATGVADRARERMAQVIYLDAFVPKDGQALIDLAPDDHRRRILEGARSGDGWRVPPNPIPPDTAPEDVDWIMRHRRPMSIKCFEQPLGLQGELALPRAYIYCKRIAPGDPFRPFAERAKTESGWRYYELDASHSPNVTAPKALVKLINEVVASAPRLD